MSKASGIFLNISNHPSEKWTDKQYDAASGLANGPVWDIPFPNVPADAREEEVSTLASEMYDRVVMATHAMVQGEFTLTYGIVQMLKKIGIKVVAACSERQVIEKDDGTKTVTFKFVQFREYI